MKVNLKPRHRIGAFAAVALVCITLIAWKQQPRPQVGDAARNVDTLPAKKQKTSEVREFDKELEKLERAIEKLSEEKTADFEAIAENLHAQLNNIDVDNAMLKAELAIKDLDFAKVNAELQKALKSVEFELKQKKLNESLAEISIDKREINGALADVRSALKKELEEINSVEPEEWKSAMAELNGKNIMAEVTAEIEKASKILKDEHGNLNNELATGMAKLKTAGINFRDYKEMIGLMEKDQLLDTKKDYKVVYREGILYINDNKQIDEVTAKYRKFLKGNVTIIKKQGNLDINIENNNTHFD